MPILFNSIESLKRRSFISAEKIKHWHTRQGRNQGSPQCQLAMLCYRHLHSLARTDNTDTGTKGERGMEKEEESVEYSCEKKNGFVSFLLYKIKSEKQFKNTPPKKQLMTFTQLVLCCSATSIPRSNTNTHTHTHTHQFHSNAVRLRGPWQVCVAIATAPPSASPPPLVAGWSDTRVQREREREGEREEEHERVKAREGVREN